MAESRGRMDSWMSRLGGHGEVRHVLTREVSNYLRTAEFLERADTLAATTSGTKQTDSTMLIREDRDR